jgi:predicted ArsR family transcriptional regulator
MSYFDDLPEWRLEELYNEMVSKRREARAKKLGRPILTWGGKRKGAGRPKVLTYNNIVKLNLNSIQQKVLEEMGEGDLAKGIEKLINEAM